jgi:HD superfamily phosphohydrolase
MDIESEKQMNELAELKLDRDRLDWLLRDTIFLSEISTRKKIDEAMKADWFERERHDKIMSGM